jgi:hypothetical protein
VKPDDRSYARPQEEYGDPLKALEKREELGCKGCRHERKSTYGGKVKWLCSKSSLATPMKHGRRCRLFQESGY